MFTKTQLQNMNADRKYSSFGWIKNINTLDDKKMYTLSSTGNATISNGREYEAIAVITNKK